MTFTSRTLTLAIVALIGTACGTRATPTLTSATTLAPDINTQVVGETGAHPTSVTVEPLRVEVHDTSSMGEGIESVFVHNTGEYLVDIGGWVIQSHAASHGFTFPQGTTVVPGSSVGVYENAVIGEKCPMDTARFFFACNEFGTPRTTRDFCSHLGNWSCSTRVVK